MIKVFGIGLSRTGTTSLTGALQQVGYRAAHFPSDPATQEEIYRHFDSGAEALSLSLLQDLDAITDTPVCCVYQALERAYPEKKFVLNVREKEAWLASCHQHWTQVLPVLLREEDAAWGRYTTFINETLYGVPGWDREAFARAYDRYHAGVRGSFAGRDDLLVLDVCAGEGWEKLAPFLEVPSPATPFPRANPGVRRRRGLRTALSSLRHGFRQLLG